MTVPTDDPSRGWTPQPLPEDDVLAKEPAPEDLALVAAATVEVPAPVDDEPELMDDEPAPVDDEPALVDDQPALVTEPAPDDDQASVDPSPVDPLPDDAELPPSVQLLHSGEETSPGDQRGWVGLLVGAVLAMFFVFVPVQVMVGNLFLWTAAFIIGGTLTIAGGIATGQSVQRRGTTRAGPLVAFGSGAVILVVCAVVAIVGAQAVS